jgi:ABC-2 type transport system permease protein
MSIKQDITILKHEIKNEVNYRANAIMASVSSLLYLIVNIMVWNAIFANNTAARRSIITYIILVVLATGFINDNLQSEFSKRVKDGSICTDFLLPFPFKRRMLLLALGKSTCSILFSTLPVFVIAIIFWGITPPTSFINLFLYITSQFIGILLGLEINFFLGQLIIRNGRSEPTQFAFWALMTIFGGRFIPVWYYPKVLSVIASLLPFHLLYSTPISIYQGTHTSLIAIAYIFYSVCWLMGMKLINFLVLKQNIKTLSIQGG